MLMLRLLFTFKENHDHDLELEQWVDELLVVVGCKLGSGSNLHMNRIKLVVGKVRPVCD
jgi:hypothetical protein